MVDLADLPRVQELQRRDREDADRRAFWLQMELRKSEGRVAELSAQLDMLRAKASEGGGSVGSDQALVDALCACCQVLLDQPERPRGLDRVAAALRAARHVDPRVAAVSSAIDQQVPNSRSPIPTRAWEPGGRPDEPPPPAQFQRMVLVPDADVEAGLRDGRSRRDRGHPRESWRSDGSDEDRRPGGLWEGPPASSPLVDAARPLEDPRGPSSPLAEAGHPLEERPRRRRDDASASEASSKDRGGLLQAAHGGQRDHPLLAEARSSSAGSWEHEQGRTPESPNRAPSHDATSPRNWPPTPVDAPGSRSASETSQASSDALRYSAPVPAPAPRDMDSESDQTSETTRQRREIPKSVIVEPHELPTRGSVRERVQKTEKHITRGARAVPDPPLKAAARVVAAPAVRSDDRGEELRASPPRSSPPRQSAEPDSVASSADVERRKKGRRSKGGSERSGTRRAKGSKTRTLHLGLVSGLIEIGDRSCVLCVLYGTEEPADAPRWRRTRMYRDGADFELERSSITLHEGKCRLAIADEAYYMNPGAKVLASTELLKSADMLDQETDVPLTVPGDGRRVGTITVLATAPDR